MANESELLSQIETLYKYANVMKSSKIPLKLFIDPFIKEHLGCIFKNKYTTIIEYLIAHYDSEQTYFDDFSLLKCFRYTPQYCQQILSFVVYINYGTLNTLIYDKNLETLHLIAEKFGAEIYQHALRISTENKVSWLLENKVNFNKGKFYVLMCDHIDDSKRYLKIKNYPQLATLSSTEFFSSPDTTFPQYEMIKDTHVISDFITETEEEKINYDRYMKWFEQYCSVLNPNVLILAHHANEKDIYMITILDIRKCCEVEKDICRYVGGEFIGKNTYQFNDESIYNYRCLSRNTDNTMNDSRNTDNGKNDEKIVKKLREHEERCGPSTYFHFDHDVILYGDYRKRINYCKDEFIRYHITKLTPPLSLEHLCLLNIHH